MTPSAHATGDAAALAGAVEAEQHLAEMAAAPANDVLASLGTTHSGVYS